MLYVVGLSSSQGSLEKIDSWPIGLIISLSLQVRYERDEMQNLSNKELSISAYGWKKKVYVNLGLTNARMFPASLWLP